MSLEILESRIAPAGVVTIEVSSGVLELTGDDAGAEIVIEQIAAKKFLITGIDTQLQGPDGLTTELVVSKVSSIKGTFGSAGDDIEIQNAKLKSLTLDLGQGDNAAMLITSKTSGATSVVGGSGVDSVTLTGISWSSASFRGDLGEGTNSVDFDADNVSAGTVNVKGGVGMDRFFVSSTSAKFKDVTLDFGDGNNRVNLFAPNLTLGNLSFTSGNGNDRFDSTVDRFTIKNATLSLGSGDNELSLEGSTTRIIRSLSIGQGDNTSASGSSIDIDNGGVFSVGRDFTIQNGAGEFDTDLTTSTLSVGGNFLVEHASLDDSRPSTTVTASQALTVKGNLTLVSLAGRYTTDIYGAAAVKVLGKTSITQGDYTGAGRSDVSITSDGVMSLKAVEFLTGNADIDVELIAARLSTSDISGNAGDGRLSLQVGGNIVQAKGSITLDSAFASELTLTDYLQLSVTGDVNIVGLGNLRVYGESGTIKGSVTTSNAEFSPDKTFTIGRDLDILAPDDGLLTNIARTIVKGDTTIVGGNLGNSIGIFSSQFFGEFNATTGTDFDIVFIDAGPLKAGKGSQFFGPVTIDVGAGSDDLSIGVAESEGPATFHDTVTLIPGTGTNGLRIDSQTVFKQGEPATTGWVLG